jgi:hypothetical protein
LKRIRKNRWQEGTNAAFNDSERVCGAPLDIKSGQVSSQNMEMKTNQIFIVSIEGD